MNTQDSITQVPVDLMINLDDTKRATGSLLVDEGESMYDIDNNLFDYLKFEYSDGSLRTQWVNDVNGKGGLPNSFRTQNRALGNITLVNSKTQNIDFACWLDTNNEFHTLNKHYHLPTKTWTLWSDLQITFKKAPKIFFGDSTQVTNPCQLNNNTWRLQGQLPDLVGRTKVQMTLNLSDESEYDTTLNVDVWLVETVGSQKQQSVRVLFSGNNVTTYNPQDVFAAEVQPAEYGSLKERVRITAEPFMIEVLSYVDEQTVIWSSANYPYLTQDYLMTFGANLQTRNGTNFTRAFGLGERYGDFLIDDGKYSFWNRGGNNVEADGLLPGKNLYSTHPFISWRTKTGSFGYQFVRNAAAYDVTIKSNKTDGTIGYEHIAVGGPLDLYISEGDTPDEVVQSYQSFLGFPDLVPIWMLGWNQARSGYKDLAELDEVRRMYIKNNIPLDVMWSDLDYLRDFRNLEVDRTRYPDLAQYVLKNLTANGQKYVVAVDASIPMVSDPSYAPYKYGEKMGLFIKDYTNMTTLAGRSIAGEAAFIDWTSSNIEEQWYNFLNTLKSETAFSGVWLKNNEAFSMCDGSCNSTQLALDSVEFKAQYWPTGRNLNNLALSVDAMHANNFTELDMHNMYGHLMTKETQKFFTNKQFRGLVMSESAFAGTGKFGQKSLGNNFSSVSSMKFSIASIMSMGVFGFPATGADICGYIGNTSPELCARWTMLSMYYPFARNNNQKGADLQEPFQPMFDVVYPDAIKEGTTYKDIMIQAIKNRYALLPYLYSHMMQIAYGGGSYLKPVFFEFPMNTETYDSSYNTFMIGRSLKVSQTIDKLGSKQTNFYFPAGSWCPVWDMTQPCLDSDTPQSVSLRDSADVSNLHLREGFFAPMVNITNVTIQTVRDVQERPVDIHVSPAINDETGVGFSAYMAEFNVDGGELFDSKSKLNQTVNSYEFYLEGVNGTEFRTYINLNINASTALNTTDGCIATSGNDRLGDIFVHNAVKANIQSEDIVAIIIFRDSRTPLYTTNLEYIMAEAKKSVLKIPTMGIDSGKSICMSAIKEVWVTQSFNLAQLELAQLE